LGADVQPTVNGGLTFFGAPLNTYMTHAACAMVRKLRDGAKLGLLYGQGGFVTKHHGLVLSRRAPGHAISQDTSVQAEADKNRGVAPPFVTEADGRGRKEDGPHPCTILLPKPMTTAAPIRIMMLDMCSVQLEKAYRPI